MTTAHRDLASAEVWQRSLERARYRRALAPKARRENARKKQVSAALATAVVAGPSAPLAAAQVSSDPGASVASESPASRAIELREGGLPLMLGSKGDLVAHTQRVLGISADGVFGAHTDAAVRRFQYAAKLQVDGIVGPDTWSALFATSRGAAVGGSDVPPQVKEQIEQKLQAAGARLATEDGGGSAQDGWGSLGAPQATPGADGEGSPVPEGSAPGALPQAGAPADGCGSATVSSPVQGTVTSNFGPRGGRNHDGVDISAPTGTAVRAAACGTVSLAGQQSGYGNMVCVTHTSQFSTCYAHLSRFAVSNGAAVQQGQVIGYVGCTGSCTGPHLHFETRVNGQAQDPRAYLSGGAMPGKPAASSASHARKGGSTTRTTPAIGGATATTALAPAGTASTPEQITSTGASDTTQYVSPATTAPTAADPVAAETAVPAQPVAVETTVPGQPTLPAEIPVPAQPVAVETAVPTEPVPAQTTVPGETAVPAEPVVPETAVTAQPVPTEAATPSGSVPTETAVPSEPVPPDTVAPAQAENQVAAPSSGGVAAE